MTSPPRLATSLTSELDTVMVALVGHEEHGVDVRCEPPIHDRELELVLEVRERAQAAHEDRRVVAAAEVDDEPVELLELQALAGLRHGVVE